MLVKTNLHDIFQFFSSNLQNFRTFDKNMEKLLNDIIMVVSNFKNKSLFLI